MGSQARSTCGIWIRWSITAMPAKPTWSAVTAISRSQPAGSLPHGKRDSCRMTGTRPSPSSVVAAAHPTAGSAASACSVTTTTRSQPSASASAGSARIRRSWAVRTSAGTGRSRSAFRVRHSRAGVSRMTSTAGSPAAAGPVAVVPASVRIQSEGVDHRRQAAAQPGVDDQVGHGERVGGRVEIGRAGADHRPQRVGGDDLGPGVVRGRPGRLARPRPPRPAPPRTGRAAARRLVARSRSPRPSCRVVSARGCSGHHGG